MGPDFRVLVRKSRKQAEQYHRLYKEVGTNSCHSTCKGNCSCYAGVHSVWVDPSGSYFSWKASAVGKNVSNAKTFLEKRYTDDMELDDAVHTSILTLKEGFEGQISGKNIEFGIIGADKQFRVLTPAEIEDYLAEVE
ncbi:proteasome subunit alpha type-2-A-like [Juglans regia]|uniref:Proteasome subunit alpha type-2-A-like n=1 Tax=Juglans regia TaxID=51240 RepID=A0A6P9EAB3_JUGRE|nr:proteasome subunit alpha type-2-A-like [Juglans regia]